MEHVHTQLEQTSEGSTIQVKYGFSHDYGEPEEKSIIRLYLQAKNGMFYLLNEVKGTNEIQVPSLSVGVYDDPDARLRIAVVPRTRFAAGREYLAPHAFPVAKLPRNINPVKWVWPPTPAMTVATKKRGTKVTLLTAEPTNTLQSGGPDGKRRIQLHALGQDNSFHLIRDLTDERTFVLDTGLYNLVRITNLGLESEEATAPKESLLFNLR